MTAGCGFPLGRVNSAHLSPHRKGGRGPGLGKGGLRKEDPLFPPRLIGSHKMTLFLKDLFLPVYLHLCDLWGTHELGVAVLENPEVRFQSRPAMVHLHCQTDWL